MFSLFLLRRMQIVSVDVMRFDEEENEGFHSLYDVKERKDVKTFLKFIVLKLPFLENSRFPQKSSEKDLWYFMVEHTMKYKLFFKTFPNRNQSISKLNCSKNQNVTTLMHDSCGLLYHFLFFLFHLLKSLQNISYFFSKLLTIVAELLEFKSPVGQKTSLSTEFFLIFQDQARLQGFTKQSSSTQFRQAKSFQEEKRRLKDF